MPSDAPTLTRRAFVGGGATLAAVGAAGGELGAIPESTLARVIVDNDFAGDPDGLIALAHQLLVPKARCTLITTSALDPKLARLGGKQAGATAAAGREAAHDLIGRMHLASAPPVIAGAEHFGVGPQSMSDAAKAIAAEAMRPDPLPLYVACGGPLTNVAAALWHMPAIASRFTLVWIGGGEPERGGAEYNLATDAAAARQVVEESRVPLWQVPERAYRQLQLSMAEMEADLEPLSSLSQWLCGRYRELPPFVKLGGSIGLGDSALPLLTALSAESSAYSEPPARRVLPDLRHGEAIPGRTIRVYDRLDTRLALNDLAARLRLQARER